MKLTKFINPKSLKLSPQRIFRTKKDRSIVSRSDPSSFSSGTSSSSSSDASDTSVSNHKHASRGGSGTPTSVLPSSSGDWTLASYDIHTELSEAFKLIDRDNDGIILKSELEAFLTRLSPQPPSQEEVATMLRELETDDEGGCISVQALMCQIGPACQPAGDEDLRETFEFFDTDHDGRISAEELLRVFTAIGDEQCTIDDCRRMIAEVDKNGDGFVCFDDFSRLMYLHK